MLELLKMDERDLRLEISATLLYYKVKDIQYVLSNDFYCHLSFF